MSEAIVTVRGTSRRGGRQFPIRINGSAANFKLGADRIEASFLRSIDERLGDFLAITATVFAADSRVRRGGLSRPALGADWRRGLHFRIPVCDHDFWSREEVRSALIRATGFLTDDDVSFEFVPGRAPLVEEGILEFGADAPVFACEDVILFSGGLDSLAGTIETLTSGTGKVVLVTHFSAQKRMKYPQQLVGQLNRRFPGRILWIPVTARLRKVKAVETTQRSRSLLFTALGFLAARLSGATRLHLFENGIVSANLPISSQVIGSMASRTTHPLALAHLASLLELIAPSAVTLDNQYAWSTKTEVTERLAANGGAEFIKWTNSCSSVREQAILESHCGACSQCLDRRFAVLAAGLADHDPEEMYTTDVLHGARPTNRSRTMALDWTRHALSLAEISDTNFLARFGADHARLVEPVTDRPFWQAARDVIVLHRRHGAAVRRVMADCIQRSGTALVDRTLPETSLLRMMVLERVGSVTVPLLCDADMRAEHALAPDDSVEPATIHEPRSSIFPLEVELSGTGSETVVTVHGLGSVRGANATPVSALKPFHDEDRARGRRREHYRFLPSGALASSLGITKPAVRQRVKRLRDDLAEYHAAVFDAPPDQDLLIENDANRSYRLDPDCRFVAGET